MAAMLRYVLCASDPPVRSLVGGVHEQRVRVGVGIGGDGDAAGVMAGVDDAHGDFATVGDEDAP